jgi:hypothetical protein
MSTRKALAVRRAEFVSGVIEVAPCRSRARELVESGVLDRATDIAEFAHSLTDSVVSAMEAACRERGGNIAEIRSARSACFRAIVYDIVHRLERGERR